MLEVRKWIVMVVPCFERWSEDRNILLGSNMTSYEQLLPKFPILFHVRLSRTRTRDACYLTGYIDSKGITYEYWSGSRNRCCLQHWFLSVYLLLCCKAKISDIFSTIQGILHIEVVIFPADVCGSWSYVFCNSRL